jgi:type III pantothenate kinase
MNLVIDLGNSLFKIAVFDQQEMVFVERHKDPDPALIQKVLSLYPKINKSIIGTVRETPENISALIKNQIPLIILNAETPLPISLHYQTPNTLGADRIAAVTAANHLFPGKNLLVIEAGTCITYDFIDSDGIYHGGSISPGIALRFSALHNFTDKLPLVEAKQHPELIGNSTESSIQSGVIIGAITEFQGIISRYEHNYDNLTIIISGGDLNYFDKNLKNNIFAVPNIVLTGLNIILDFNDKN